MKTDDRLKAMSQKIEQCLRRYIDDRPIGGMKIDDQTYIIKSGFTIKERPA